MESFIKSENCRDAEIRVKCIKVTHERELKNVPNIIMTSCRVSYMKGIVVRKDGTATLCLNNKGHNRNVVNAMFFFISQAF